MHKVATPTTIETQRQMRDTTIDRQRTEAASRGVLDTPPIVSNLRRSGTSVRVPRTTSSAISAALAAAQRDAADEPDHRRGRRLRNQLRGGRERQVGVEPAISGDRIVSRLADVDG